MKNWGMSANIDGYDCNPQTIRSKPLIESFVQTLCFLIDVKPFGPCTIVHFGENKRIAGYSMTQLIETSLISAHFANATNTFYLDVFSCKEFDTEKVAALAKRWFSAESIRINITERI